MEKILFLRSIPIFAALKMFELAHVAEIAEEVDLPKGELLFRENEMGDCLYIVVSGSVDVIKQVEGREKIIAVLGEKESVGEMSILDSEPRSATVRAGADVKLLKISSDDFTELLGENPGISFGIFRVFTKRLRQKNVESETAAVVPSHSM
ncbi:MAG TPA: cyclic nucleotide-binding domain-containing protein [bacterium]|nr:cyclic nucleotide-binding domain-containing protein [bacterium]